MIMKKTKAKVKPPLICSICGNPIQPNWHGWAGGNNAQPVNNGRCCSDCDAMVVIPARIQRSRPRVQDKQPK